MTEQTEQTEQNTIIQIIVIIGIFGLIILGTYIFIKSPEKLVNTSHVEFSSLRNCIPETQTKFTGANGTESIIEIVGITNYNGHEVCESKQNTINGAILQYYSEDLSYLIIVQIDKSGKVISTIDRSKPKS